MLDLVLMWNSPDLGQGPAAAGGVDPRLHGPALLVAAHALVAPADARLIWLARGLHPGLCPGRPLTEGPPHLRSVRRRHGSAASDERLQLARASRDLCHPEMLRETDRPVIIGLSSTLLGPDRSRLSAAQAPPQPPGRAHHAMSNGPEINAPKRGMTLSGNVPRSAACQHTSLCGGKGRCTTCRVVVEEGLRPACIRPACPRRAALHCRATRPAQHAAGLPDPPHRTADRLPHVPPRRATHPRPCQPGAPNAGSPSCSSTCAALPPAPPVSCRMTWCSC